MRSQFSFRTVFLLNHALTIPSNYENAWQLTHINDYSKMNALYGCQNYTYKNWETSTEAYTADDYAQFKADFEAGLGLVHHGGELLEELAGLAALGQLIDVGVLVGVVGVVTADHDLIKRLLQSVLTVLIIVTIVFLCMRALPTDFFFTEDQMMKLDDQQKEDILAKAGLLDPIPTQLFRYYGQVL